MFQVKKICTGIGICAVSVGALYFAALISIPCLVDLNRYKEPVISEIEKQTGLKVTCENISFKRSLAPYFRVNLFHTMVMYPNSEVFLKLKEIDLKIKIFPLLLKKIIIKDAVFQRPIINITLYKDLTTSLEHLIPDGKSINTGGHNLVSPAFFDDSSSPKNWGSPFQGATQKFRSRSLSRNFLGHFQIEGTVYNTLLYDYKLKIKDESIKKEFYFEGGELVLRDIKLNDKMHFVLKGALYESGNEYLKYDLDILMPLKENRHVLFSPFKYIYESDIKGEVYGHIKYQSADNVTGSIKINDLSLRTGKTKIDNNNFSVIFEGAQAKFEALIHSSKTDIVKLNGNLGFGKNKFINCSAYAKNVNLENLYNVASAISDIMNLKINLHDYKISGLIDADFNINSDFKKLTSSGHALFSNAKISHKQLPYKITDINADINFNNNRVQILKAAANINQTPLNIKGQINEDVSYKIEVFSKDLNLNKLTELFKLKLPFLVLNGNLSFESSLEGVLYKSFFVRTKALINNLKLKEADKNIIITADSAEVDFDGNEKKFNGNSRIDKISINIPRQSILISAIKLLFDENNITIKEGQIINPNKVNFEGVINNYLKSPEGQIDITGNIQSESLGKIVDKLVKLPYKASGAIHTAGKLKFGKSGNNIKLQLKSNENNYLSYLVVKELLKKPVIHNFDIDLEKDSVKINNISIYEDSAPSVSVYLSNLEKYKKIISLNGNIINLKSPEFQNFHINIPEKISFASNFFGGEEAEIRADIKLNGNINNPELRGSAKIDKYNLKRYLTSINNANISFADNNIRLIAPDVRVNNSKFNLTADIEPSLKPDKAVISSLHINSLNLDLNTLFELIMKERNFLLPDFFVIKKGSATINNFKILDLKAHDISSDLTFDNNTLKLTNISASAYNGHIQGSSSYNVSTGALSLKMEGNGLDIKSSVYDLCKLEDNISGTTDLKANISMMTGPYNEVIKSLSGKASFKAKNGRMGTLGKFEYYLHAQNILYHGFLNTTLNRIADAIIPDNTAQYREASGEILFQNGFIISDNIKTSGDKMSLYLKGRHNLLTNHANIEIFGRISDEISHKLGTFGEVSLSEIINGQSADKNVMVYKVPYETINKIPDLYNNNTAGTNTFKVNIYGNLDSLGAINSFIWIKADKENITPKEDKLPDFSDISPL